MNNNVLQNGSYFYYSDEDQMVYQYSMSKTDKGLQLDVQKWGDFAFLFPDLVNKLIEKDHMENVKCLTPNMSHLIIVQSNYLENLILLLKWEMKHKKSLLKLVIFMNRMVDGSL